MHNNNIIEKNQGNKIICDSIKKGNEISQGGERSFTENCETLMKEIEEDTNYELMLIS